MSKSPDLGPAKRIMAAMLKLPPKPHTDMKIGKEKPQRLRRQRKKRPA
jgi:hypothetical protein